MKFRVILASVPLLASAFALSACGSSQTEAPSDAATDTAMAIATDSVEPVVPAQQFVDTASASDLFETEAGKLAQSMGDAKDVKDFGAMMVKDHATSTSNLKAAIAKGAAEVTIAPKLTAEQKSNLDALKAAEGKDFDKLYKEQQVAAHEQALTLLKSYSAGGDNADLRDFAGQTSPVVQHHLDAARMLP